MQDGRGSADSHQTRYRPDIDGIRALAVLSVIAFHLFARLLPGGYLGVDIFFVLSGYLITNILVREASSGTFSILRFYERRIRRIMPALLFVLIAVSVAAIVLLLPIDLTGYAHSLFATLTFVANVYFWRDTNYFSRIAAEKPLLHCWSLGVEEQFYILFPLLIYLCFRWRRSLLGPLVALLVAVSLVGNIVAIRIGAALPAFYMLPTRAWELGAGALLAILPIVKIKHAPVRHLVGVIAAFFLGIALYSGNTLFFKLIPFSLLVVLGTVLTIHLGNTGGSWLNKTFSAPPLVAIGLISYSLYLWHWPVLVFGRYYLVRDFTLTEAVCAIAFAFLASYISWRYIERPFRNKSISIRKVLVWTLSVTAILVLTAFSILASHGFPQRDNANAAKINAAVGANYRCAIGDYIAFGASRGCLMAMSTRNPEDATVVLLGNSHAQMYAPLVTGILRENGQHGVLVPANGCLPMTDVNISPGCRRIAVTNLAATESLPHVRVVVLGFNWNLDQPLYNSAGIELPLKDNVSAFMSGVDHLVQRLQHDGKVVALIGPIQTPHLDIASVLARELAFGRPVTVPLSLPASEFHQTYGALLAHFEVQSGLIFIRPDLIQCPAARCDFLYDGNSFFADDNHIAAPALPLFKPVFEPGLKLAFRQAELQTR